MGRKVVRVLLFSDLADSTATIIALGPDAADEWRRAHDRMIRESVSASGGTEVKHTGDGFMIAYDNVRGCLEGAVLMQQATQRHNTRGGVPMTIRVGVGIGDVTEDDRDYFGRPVVEAARLCGCAEPGEVLVTDVVRLLAGDAELDFVERGRPDLKGLGPTAVHRLEWETYLASPTTVPPPPVLAREHAVSLVGRDAVVETLRGDLLSAIRGTPQFVVLRGEPGIGKTRLASELARVAASTGVSVTFGHSSAQTGAPFQPWIEALRHALKYSPDSFVFERLAGPRTELRRLMPELSDGAPVEPVPADPETQRYLLFTAIADTLAEFARQDPMLLVLDDIQWADDASLQMLAHLAATAYAVPLMVCATYRDTEPDASPALARTLSAIARAECHRIVELEGLDRDAVGELISSVIGEMPDARERLSLVNTVLGGTKGNPFFATEVLSHVAASGRTDPSKLSHPPTVESMVLSRLGSLDELARDTLVVASVIGSHFDLATLRATTSIEEDTLLDQLDEAVAIHLVIDLGDDEFEFSHALVAEILYRQLRPSRAQRLHDAVADHLAVDEDPDRIGDLAYHRLRGRRGGGDPELRSLLERAAASATERLSPREAARWLNEALRLYGDDLADTDRVRLLHGLGVAQRDSGDPAFRETLLEATAFADRVGDADRFAEIVLDNGRGMTLEAGVVDQDRIAALERALELVGPEPTAVRARLLALLGSELVWARDYDRRKGYSDEALAIARAVDDDDTLLFVLNLRHDTIQVPFEFEERMGNTAEALELADRTEDLTQAFFAAETRLRTVALAGAMEEADAMLDREDDIAERLRLPTLQWFARFHRTWVVLARGDDVLAEQLANEALMLGTEAGQRDVMEIYASALINLRLQQGRLGELKELIADTAAANPGIPGFRAVSGFILTELGELAAGRDAIAEDIAAGFGTFDWDVVWHAGTAMCAEIVAMAGDVDAAAVLLELLEPYSDLIVYTGPSIWGSNRRYLGLLERARGNLDLAEDHLRRAHERHRDLAWPFWTARTELDWAELLADMSGRRSEAGILARSAHTAAQALGNGTMRGRAERVLALTGGR